MSDRFSKPSSVWRYAAPAAEVAAGDLLPEALRSEEAAFGPTAAVLHAYAARLGAQWGERLAAFVPLGLSRGHLTAAAVYEPLFVPGLQYVQAESVEVCELYAPHVPWLKVNSRAAIEALVAAPGCVTRVDAFGVTPFEVDAPFELRWVSWSEDRPPHWFRRWTHRPFYAQLAPLGEGDWLCWDLDHHEVVSVRDEGCHAVSGVQLGDIFPHNLRGGASAPTRHTGAGWAASAEQSGTFTAAADGRRFLACNEHDPGVRQLAAIWRARKPFSEMSEGSHATFASVEFPDPQHATLQWIGRFRVLRIRDGRLEQLTRDHDMRWLMAESGEVAPEEIPDNLPRNIIGKSLPLGAPETVTVEVDPRDRLVLLPARLQELLEQTERDLAEALTRGTVEQVARWVRSVATAADVAAIAVILDANAHASWVRLHIPPPPMPLRKTTVTALVQQPAEFADQRIAARGVFHSRFEGMRFADAWFRCSPDFPPGAWLVDVEGTWRHGGQYGHFGLSASELIGTATLVAIDRPRRVAPADARHARRYVPLTSTATVRQQFQGWTWEGQWLSRLGPSAWFPVPDQPQEVDVELTYVIDGWRNIGVFSWRELARRTLEPTPAMVNDRLERGAYVQLRGFLTPPRVLEWPNDARGPYAEWPLLDGKLRIIPPAIARTSDRHATPKLAQLQPLVDAIGDGVFVVVIAEVAHDTLWATSIVGPNGAIDVDIL